MRWHPFISGVMVAFSMCALYFWGDGSILYVCLNRDLWPDVCSCVLSQSVMSDSFATSWTVAHQAPPFMGFFRQEFWSRLHFLLQRIFLRQGLNLYLLRPQHCPCLYLWAIREDQMYTFVKTTPLELGPFGFPDLRLFSAALCVCVEGAFSPVWLCDPVDCSPPGSSVSGSPVL